jgi:hypothetical protein
MVSQGTPDKASAADKQHFSCMAKATSLEALRTKVENLRTFTEATQRTLTTELAKLQVLQDTLQAQMGASGKSQRDLEFEQLLSHPDIEKIRIEGSSLIVETGMISIREGELLFDIGKFTITLPSGPTVQPTMRNKSGTKAYRQCGSMDHPHVRAGIPCLGTISTILPELIKNKQYPVAVVLCIEYLKSWNREDAHAPGPSLWSVGRRA